MPSKGPGSVFVDIAASPFLLAKAVALAAMPPRADNSRISGIVFVPARAMGFPDIGGGEPGAIFKHVLPDRHRPQVSWIAAHAIAANVINHRALWHRDAGKIGRNTMCIDHLSSDL
jgi:hypothetical protein